MANFILVKTLKKQENDLPTNVYLCLMQPFLKIGYNVTMDKNFSSTNLADKLKAEKTTLLGTIRKQRKEVSKVEKMIKG